MFMKYNEVCDKVGTAGFCKVLDDIVPPVDSVRIGKDQAHFLRQVRVNKKNKSGIVVTSSLPWQTATTSSWDPSTWSK